MAEFRMPSLGADMEAGTLIAWRVKPGDAVRRGQVIAEVETDKGLVEVEIWEDGVVESLEVVPPAKVPVGTVLAKLAGGERAPSPAARPAEEPARAPAAPMPPPAPPERGTHVSAAPAARARARELGVDLATVTGTGPHGSITRADVDAAAATRSKGEASPRAEPGRAPSASPRSSDGMRRAIAAAMSRSKREIPHYYLGARIDLTRALAWLEETNRDRPVAERILPAALLFHAIARAAREVPEMNGHYVDGAFRPSAAVHLGIAISLRDGGLVAPAIKDADSLPLETLMRRLADLISRARAGTLKSSEMSDPTLTVTNLGDLGAESVFGVIFPPQVALVGLGKIGEAVIASGGAIAVRPSVQASLSADHRVSDGARGARFLAAIDRRLQKPEEP